jgi:hypothetical protein
MAAAKWGRTRIDRARRIFEGVKRKKKNRFRREDGTGEKGGHGGRRRRRKEGANGEEGQGEYSQGG